MDDSNQKEKVRDKQSLVYIIHQQIADLDGKRKRKYWEFIQKIKQRLSQHVGLYDPITTGNFQHSENNKPKQQLNSNGNLATETHTMDLKHQVLLVQSHANQPSWYEPLISQVDVVLYFLNKATITSRECKTILRKTLSRGIPVVMLRENTFSEQALESILGKGRPSLDTESRLKYKEIKIDKAGSQRSIITHSGSIKETRGFSRCFKGRINAQGNASCRTNADFSFPSVIRKGFSNAIVYSVDEVDECIDRLFARLACCMDDVKFSTSKSTDNNILLETIPPSNMSHENRAKSSLCNTVHLPSIPPPKPKESRSYSLSGSNQSLVVPGAVTPLSSLGRNNEKLDYVKEYNKSLTLPPLDNRPGFAPNVVLYENNRFTHFSSIGNSPYNTKTTLNVSPPQAVSAGCIDSDIDNRENTYSSTPSSLESSRKTLYLVMRKYDSVPELLIWPPNGAEERCMSILDLLNENSESEEEDTSLSMDLAWEDIDLRSQSTTPELK